MREEQTLQVAVGEPLQSARGHVEPARHLVTDAPVGTLHVPEETEHPRQAARRPSTRPQREGTLR